MLYIKTRTINNKNTSRTYHDGRYGEDRLRSRRANRDSFAKPPPPLWNGFPGPWFIGVRTPSASLFPQPQLGNTSPQAKATQRQRKFIRKVLKLYGKNKHVKYFLLTDNQAAEHIATQPTMNEHSRLIDTRHHAIRKDYVGGETRIG
jgi:hypothetical protein